MKSSLLEEWVEERLEFEKQKIEEKALKIAEKASKEAAEKATIDTLINAIKEFLEEKFVFTPAAIEEKLHEISNTSALNTLLRKVYKTDTLEEFENLVDQALKNQ